MRDTPIGETVTVDELARALIAALEEAVDPTPPPREQLVAMNRPIIVRVIETRANDTAVLVDDEDDPRAIAWEGTPYIDLPLDVEDIEVRNEVVYLLVGAPDTRVAIHDELL